MRWSKRCITAILLIGPPLLAQTSALPSAVKPQAVPAAEDTPKVASPSALCSIQVLTDTQGINFDPYLSRVLHDVKQRWAELILESSKGKRGNVVLEFAILKD